MQPDTPEIRAKLRDVAEAILGTASSLDDVIQQVFGDDDLTMSDFSPEMLRDEVDDIAEECEECGWWGDAGGMDDGVCEDCQDRDDD